MERAATNKSRPSFSSACQNGLFRWGVSLEDLLDVLQVRLAFPRFFFEPRQELLTFFTLKGAAKIYVNVNMRILMEPAFPPFVEEVYN